MIVGGYSLDLYCENSGPILATGKDAHGHNYSEFPHQFFGEYGRECRAEARRKGWKLLPDGQAYCPKCTPPKRTKT